MFGTWINDPQGAKAKFRSAQPFPFLVLDNFLEPMMAEALLEEFPKPEEMPRSRDYVFGDKRELSSVARQGEASKAFYDMVMGHEFQTFISELVDKELFVDPAFHGGGFHQSGNGGFLDTHVDFNVHPMHKDWLRTLNILLYLNRDWDASYDGRLLLRSHPSQPPVGVEPLFNRGVLMLTGDSTYHGFDRMNLPDGVTRKSIATYAYQRIDQDSVEARTTGWAPESGGVGKRLLAKNYNTLVRIKTRFLGSRTARNR